MVQDLSHQAERHDHWLLITELKGVAKLRTQQLRRQKFNFNEDFKIKLPDTVP